MLKTGQQMLNAARAVSAAVVFCFVVQGLAGQATERNSSRWEPAIRAFEAADRTNLPPRNAVEFIGSSSIRLWTNATSLLPGHEIFNRGFGGSELSDSVAFVDRIVVPYGPKVIVLYAGDNDIAAGKSPEEVFRDFKEFVRKVCTSLPQAHVAFISIKPCPARERHLAKVIAANGLIKEFIGNNERLTYVDVFTSSLAADGKPRADLYLKDGLHPNEAGYKLWASIVKPVLDRLDPPSAEKQ